MTSWPQINPAGQIGYQNATNINIPATSINGSSFGAGGDRGNGGIGCPGGNLGGNGNGVSPYGEFQNRTSTLEVPGGGLNSTVPTMCDCSQLPTNVPSIPTGTNVIPTDFTGGATELPTSDGGK